MSNIVSFRRMADGTREDYELLDRSEREYALGLPDSILTSLQKLDHSLEGYPLSRLGHSLQAATRAQRDGSGRGVGGGGVDPRHRRRAGAVQPY